MATVLTDSVRAEAFNCANCPVSFIKVYVSLDRQIEIARCAAQEVSDGGIFCVITISEAWGARR